MGIRSFDLFAGIPRFVEVPADVVPSGRLPVHPGRVRDLATIESYLDAMAGDPLAGLEEAAAMPDGPDRRRALRAILKRCRERPDYGTPMAVGLMRSPEASPMLFWLYTRRAFDEGWSIEDAAGLMARLDAATVAAIARVFWQVDPRTIMFNAVLPLPAGEEDDDPPAMGRAVMHLVRRLKVPPEQVGDMTLRGFREMLRDEPRRVLGGEVDPDDEIPAGPGESGAAARRRFLDVFGRDSDDDEVAPGPGDERASSGPSGPA